jgi:S-adenosylmethionine hydrolase
MRRSICLTEPNFALAGEVRTWKFSYTLSANLPKGTLLKFDLAMQDRPTDWEIPQCDPKNKEGLIWLEIPGKKPLYPEEVYTPKHYAPAFEFTLPSEVKAGEILEFYLGTPGADTSKGLRAQTITQRRRPFHLFIDPKGKGDYKDPEIFTMDVRGNSLQNIRIFAPSLVSKNRRFDIVVRFEDAFGNLTSNADEDTLIELSYEFLRESLNWKLFVPETGFIILPNLYFNEPGVYRIQLKSSTSDAVFFSSPIKCFSDTDYSLYWGTLHGESEKNDATDNIDSFMRQMRDEIGNQFVGTSPFESIEETSNDAWKSITSHVQEYNEENRFTTMLGLQWLGDEGEGLRQIVYWKDNKPLMRKKDSKYTNLKKITKIHSPKEILVIPQFTMAKGMETDFSDYNPEHERVVEIYNAWGCSECTEKEGNLRPIKSPSDKGTTETAKGSLRAALNKNMRFGFVAGGLDDRGVYAPFFEGDQVQYSPGLTGILAIEQTRETLMQALHNRSCYATTGARIVMGFNIAGSQMGTELSTKNKPGLAFNRHINGFVCGTAPIKEIQFFCNGKELHKIQPKENTTEFEYDDFRQLKDIALDSPDERPPFAYYYLRVLQEDGHIAWSSPIWVDLSEALSEEPSTKRSRTKLS